VVEHFWEHIDDHPSTVLHFFGVGERCRTDARRASSVTGWLFWYAVLGYYLSVALLLTR
jgi:hypothetical protein